MRPGFGKLAAMLNALVAASTIHGRELQTDGAAATGATAGDEICAEGFVMDFFCINRGTLFDNPSVVTLLDPQLHSVHCLVDVPPCLASEYEVLYALPPESVTPAANHARGWRLDAASKDAVIALARGVGRRAASPGCSTCTEAEGGTLLDRGFHAGMVANVVTPSDGVNPALISITRVEPSSPDAPFCGVDGAGGTSLPAAVPTAMIVGSGSNFELASRIHGALMLVGWGIMLPSGVLVARLFKHRPDGWWFKVHRILQPLGLVFVIAGFAIALVNFDVFGPKAGVSYAHGSMGATVMALGMFQPLNAFLRPHVEEGTPKSTKRRVWEIVHKGSGYGALLLAVFTIILGTFLLPNADDQGKYQLAYGIGAGGIFLALIALALYEKRNPPAAGKSDTKEGETPGASAKPVEVAEGAATGGDRPEQAGPG